MTSPRSQRSSVEQAASEWVVRSAGALSASDAAELTRWLAADPQHAEAYARLKKTWAVFDRAAQSNAANEIATRVVQRVRQRRRRRVESAAVAAVLALGAFFYSRYSASPPDGQELATPLVADAVQTLPDGTVVELKPGAKIDAQFDAAERRVVLLSGEAHFNVAKDAAHPFRVRAGVVDVVAVGTAFTVQLAPRAIEVVVTEGRVSIAREHAPATSPSPSRSPTITYLDAGNRALLDTTHPAEVVPVVTAMTGAEIEKRLAWRTSLLEFDGTELAKAVALINRANHVQIAFADESIGKLRVSGSFRADNPEGFVRIVEATFELKVDRAADDRIVFRRP